MITSDIGVVDHALERFKDYVPDTTLEDAALVEKLKALVLERFHDKKMAQHILDDSVEAWLLRLEGSPLVGSRKLFALPWTPS